MCIFLFLEPSRCSPYAVVSQFLQPSRHFRRSCVSNLCKHPAIMSHFSTFFHFFFDLPFLTHQLPSVVVPLLRLFFHTFSFHALVIATLLAETITVHF